MEHRIIMRNLDIGLILLVIAGFILQGCAGAKPVTPSGVMDNPGHHVFTGMKFLDRNELDKALEEFNRAKELDKKYPPAYVGTGLALGAKGDFKGAFKEMDKGIDLAESPADRDLAHTGMIRLYTAQGEEDWLESAEKEFIKALKADPGSSEAHFFMAEAYKKAYVFDKAGEMYKKVLDINKDYISQADEGWKLTQKIQRAAPGTKIGKKIALVGQITRADVAALFVEEMELEKVFKKKRLIAEGAEFRTPQEAEVSPRAGTQPLPEDVVQHPLKADIGTVLTLHIRGLEPFDDKTFKPDEPITRANYALMIEDILARVLGDESLTRKYLDSASPFPDVRPDHYAFNAIMVCTTRDIIQAELDGTFGLGKPVSGADALLIIRRLKEELRIF